MKWLVLILFVGLAAVGLASCENAKPLGGKRISIFELGQKLKVEKKEATRQITLPPLQKNADWNQVGVSAAHTPQHLTFGTPKRMGAREVRRTKVGEVGVAPFVFPPIVAQNKIYILDGKSRLNVFDRRSGKKLWSRSFYQKGSFGGTLAYARGRIFVATGGGVIAALAAANGDRIWQHKLDSAFRAAPVIWQDKVFFMSFNNILTVRDASTGKEVWNHNGISESSSLLLSSAVAVADNIAIVPYNSGEVFALNAQDRRFLWTDNLLRQGFSQTTNNAGFIAVPAIDKNHVYLISNADNVVAINLRNGERVWSQFVSGVNMPWVAGKQLYVVSEEGFLLCLSRAKGLVLWRARLPQGEAKGGGKGEKGLVWFGPVLASGSLWLTSSDGRLAQVSATSGRLIGVSKLSEGFNVAPVFAAERMFLLSQNLELIELQPEK